MFIIYLLYRFPSAVEHLRLPTTLSEYSAPDNLRIKLSLHDELKMSLTTQIKESFKNVKTIYVYVVNNENIQC